MVDTYVSDAYAARCEGSIPFLGTKEIANPRLLKDGDFHSGEI